MYVEREPEDCGWRRRVGLEEKKCRRFEVVGVPPSWIENCNSVSSLVGMVLFSSRLVLVVGLEEKKLERQTEKKMRHSVML